MTVHLSELTYWYSVEDGMGWDRSGYVMTLGLFSHVVSSHLFSNTIPFLRDIYETSCPVWWSSCVGLFVASPTFTYHIEFVVNINDNLCRHMNYDDVSKKQRPDFKAGPGGKS